MANPSLQIGNGKWAIKEDNLLGYSKAGTRFVPEPITMTRASAGTRVNSSGLVETVELLGSEEVTNGDFATDSNWTKGTGWTISGGSASFNTTTNNSLTQSGFANSKIYKVSIGVVSYVRGNPFIAIGQGSQYTIPTSIGTHIIYVTSGSVDAILRIYSGAFGSGGEGSIDNVSVKESTKNNLARVDYDGTASSLLAEPERTNLITYSEDFSQWIASGSMTVGNSSSVASPSNENSVGIMTGTTGTTSKFARIDVTTTSQTHTYSAFFKYNTQQFVQFASGGTSEYANFDIQNGVVGNKLSSVTSTIESFGNGWYRCTLSTSVASQPSNMAAVLIDSATSARLSSTSSTNSLYIWGASLEEGSYPTSYIPTDGGTVTRVQDQYSKTGISNLINSEEGVLFVEFYAESDSTEKWITLSDGTATNRVIVYIPASNTLRVYVQNSSGGQADLGASITLGQFNKVAFKYKENDFALWLNGVEVATDSSGGVPVGLNRLNFSAESGTYNYFYGKVKQLQVYDTALSDDELTILTGTSGVHFYPSYAAMASVLTYKI